MTYFSNIGIVSGYNIEKFFKNHIGDVFPLSPSISASPDVSDQNLAFYDYLKPLVTIVGETKLFHLRPLDMKSEVSGAL